MSAECSKCGTDLVYGDEYPDMFCEPCDLRSRLALAETENEHLRAAYVRLVERLRLATPESLRAVTEVDA